MTNGFVYVASVNRLYYELALYSCQTLRDHYDQAHVTLFTHEKFLDHRATKLFDQVITHIPVHVRAKMWAMARTPYDKTIYIDCDSMIMHKHVRQMHDFLSECDLFCGDNTAYTVSRFNLTHFDRDCKHPVMHHGSMWGYNKTDITIDFMQTWFDQFVIQLARSDWPYAHMVDITWKQFDMFTLWRLLVDPFKEGFDRFKSLNVKILPTRWNCSGQTLKKHLDGPKVIMQVDKHTWEQSSSIMWKQIMQGANHVEHSVDKSKAKTTAFTYN